MHIPYIPRPDILGSVIAGQIPKDDEKVYQAWLEAERQLLASLEANFVTHLEVGPGLHPEKYHSKYRIRPSWFLPCSTEIEWIYILDLDNEVFSINNRAHLKLDLTPKPPPITVKPKNLAAIPMRRRHGATWRSIIFSNWSASMYENETLEAHLLQWSPEDFPFREIAFAILCLASGGKNITILPEGEYIDRGSDAYGLWKPNDDSSEDDEFIAHLAAGTHLKDLPSGSAPAQTIYWLDGVLVNLASQLFRSDILEAQISSIVSYCSKNHASETVDAVLISMEHIILLKITPNANLRRSALLTLFDIPNHLSMDVIDRYHASYLENLHDWGQKSKEANDRPLKGMHLSRQLLRGTQNGAEGDLRSAFFALCHLFDAAARRKIPVADAHGGRLPNEIITEILSYVTDVETRTSCMHVSNIFRDICQEKYLFADKMMIEPYEVRESIAEPTERGKQPLNLHDVATGKRSLLWVILYESRYQKKVKCLMVTVGSGRNRNLP
ncbi:MAG: hypothetical protein Q9221_001091 [Calogaya cf. arnoldii]